MPEENEFGKMLESLQKGKGWTQEDAAAHLGVVRHTYSDWKTGKRLPSPEKLKHIAATFKLSQADEEALYRAAAHESPKIHNLPFPRNPLFTGREAELGQLTQYLQESGSVALTQPVSISGLGGIGKTQLALEYAYSCYRTEMYRAVLWVSAADKTALETDYVKLAHKLELPDLNDREPYRSVQAVKDWLERHTNWLLIMDNADDLELTRSFFPEAHQGHILLTTRSQFGGKIGARQLEIDKMELEEGLVFLLRRTRKLEGDANPDTLAADIREPAHQLVELLDRHPLALDQAGAYIEETGESFAIYINLYNKHLRLFLGNYGEDESEPSKRPEYSHHPETVVVTFELCFEMARKRHPLATEILNFCAFLHPDNIPEELFQHDDGFKVDTPAFNRGIRALRRYSLIMRNVQKKTFSIHRLVQAVLIDDTLSDIQKQCRERVVRALNTVFPDDAEFKDWWQCRRLLPHVLAYATWTEDELTPAVEVAELFHKAHVYLYDLGEYSVAEKLMARALSIYEQHLGTEHPYTTRSLQLLSGLYHEQGKYEQAALMSRRALKIFEKHAENPDTALPLLELIPLLYYHHNQGKLEQAEALYQRTLNIHVQQLGATNPLVQAIKRFYVIFLRSIGRDAEAAALETNDEPSV